MSNIDMAMVSRVNFQVRIIEYLELEGIHKYPLQDYLKLNQV